LTVFLLKVLLAPGLVVASTLVARRFGSRMGGIVGGLPAIAGPILFVIALQHSRSFASHAATGSVLGVIAVMGFILAYVAASTRYGLRWPAAVAAGWTAFLVVLLVLEQVHVGAVVALCLAAAATAATLVLLPRPTLTAPVTGETPRFDVPLRAVCAIVPVVVVTAAAGLLGPHLSGLVASVPIITPVLAAFTQAQRGPREAARLLHGTATGFYGYALFCFTVSVTLRHLGVAASFALALAAAFAVQGVSLVLASRHERRGGGRSRLPVEQPPAA
jgi:hypothetical protein